MRSAAERLALGFAAVIVLGLALAVAMGMPDSSHPPMRPAVAPVRPELSATLMGQSQPEASQSGPPEMTAGEAAELTQVQQLVARLRIAAARDDRPTTRAIILGISKHGENARKPLLNALEKERNPLACGAIHEALDSLGEP